MGVLSSLESTQPLVTTRRHGAPPLVGRGSLTFAFDERKAAQAAAWLLRHAPEQRLKSGHLVRLLYLADRELLVTRGKPITGDALVSLPSGPSLQTLASFAQTGPRRSRLATEGNEWARYIVWAGRYDVAVDGESPTLTGALSRSEFATLDSVQRQFGSTDPWEPAAPESSRRLFPEWKDPRGRARRIDAAELLRSHDWLEEDISEIAGLAQTERLMFASRR